MNIQDISQINADSKNVINSRPYEWNDQNTVSELFTRLKIDEPKKDTPHSIYKNNSCYGMNSKNNTSIKSSTDYIDMCKKQSLMRTFQSGFNNTDKNSDVAKANLIKNIEFVKKQTEIRKNKKMYYQILKLLYFY